MGAECAQGCVRSSHWDVAVQISLGIGLLRKVRRESSNHRGMGFIEPKGEVGEERVRTLVSLMFTSSECVVHAECSSPRGEDACAPTGGTLVDAMVTGSCPLRRGGRLGCDRLQ